MTSPCDCRGSGKIRYTNIYPVPLAAFYNDYQQLFVGSESLVYVAVLQNKTIPGYTFITNFYVEEIPVIENLNNSGFAVYSNVPTVLKIDNGKSILGTWYASNGTNTNNNLMVIMGHKV